MKKNIVTIVLSLALAVVGYLLGSSNATLRDHEMREARGRLGINLRIYEEAQHGDLQAVQSHLGMVILGQIRIYEQQYGVPTGTNSFVEKFGRAQVIAAQIESNLVPVSSLLTNFSHMPEAKVTFDGEK
ncbi:MAG: hypothetical protein WCS42_12910 [Verrucomicrobiota bacterium]